MDGNNICATGDNENYGTEDLKRIFGFRIDAGYQQVIYKEKTKGVKTNNSSSNSTESIFLRLFKRFKAFIKRIFG